MAKQILVTGGMGYIGSHTVVALLEQGYEPIIVDNLANSTVKMLTQVEKITGHKPAFHQIDLCYRPALQGVLEKYPGIKDVIHFAAFKAVGESVEQPLRYYQNNLVSLLNLIQAFENQTLNLVFSSSCSIYGNPEHLPVTETESIKRALSPYGNTKKISEEILQDIAQAQPNLQVIALRYFNPVGAHASTLIGEFASGVPANLVPYITQTVIGRRKQLSVFGNDYPTPDGTCIRDYIHITDLAEAHLKAIEVMQEDKINSGFLALNVGTGRGYSVLEVIKTFEQVTNQKVNFTIAPRRSGDAANIFADPSSAQKHLKWKAKYTLSEMLQSAWDWEKYLIQNTF